MEKFRFFLRLEAVAAELRSSRPDDCHGDLFSFRLPRKAHDANETQDPTESSSLICGGGSQPKKYMGKKNFMVTFYRRAVPFRVGKYAQTVRHRIPRRIGILLALAGTDFTRNLDTFLRTARDRTFCLLCQTQNFIDADQSMKTTATGLEKFSRFFIQHNPEPRALSLQHLQAKRHNAAAKHFPQAKMVDGELSALSRRSSLHDTRSYSSSSSMSLVVSKTKTRAV